MASPGFRLPEYEYPKNALLNFAPINDAITNYQNQQQQGVENERQNKLLGFKQQEMDQSSKRFQMDQEKFSDDRLDKAKAELGNVALLTLQNPQQYGPNWSKAVDLYKASALKRNPNSVIDERHYDPTHGPMLALSSANMGQQWLDHQVKQRQVQFQGNADKRASEAEARASAAWPGAQAAARADLEAKELALQAQRRDLENPTTSVDLGPGHARVTLNKSTGLEQNRIEGPPKPMNLSPGEITKMVEDGGKYSNINGFANTFKPHYAGYTFGGETSMWGARNGMPVGAGREAAEWWQGYDRHKNVVRNELFGAALTPSEQAQFDKADITPNMDPKIIKKNLEEQRRIIQDAARRKGDALIAGGADRNVISKAYGFDTQQPAAAGPGGWKIERVQ